ncbi:MAG: FtsX-like permease family protein, partial [Caldilinea sp.]
MAIGWLKIWRDLRCYPQQTGYALLAVASSVFVVTTLLTTHSLLVKSLNHTLSARPQPDALYAASGVGKTLLAQMQMLPGIAHVGAGRIESFRVRYDDELWHELRLQASSDLTPTQGLRLVSGTWPTSAPVTVALERSSQAVTAARPGATLRLYRDDRGEIPVTVTGLIDDPAATPSRFLSNLLHGFATVEGLSTLTGEHGYDWVYVFLSPDLTPTTQKQTLAAVEDLLTAGGYAIHPRHPDGPNQTLFRFIEAALLLLSVFAVLSILLSGVWVSHVMTGILLREQIVIGVLKTLGFQRWQIAALYLGQALLLGAVAALAGSLLGSGAGLLAANATASGLLDKSLTHTVPPLSGIGVGLGV